MITRRHVLPVFVLLLNFLSSNTNSQSILDSLAIEVTGTSREFAYTNKETAFYYGETNSDNTSSWQGFNVFGHEFLDDYAILVDGVELKRSSALKATVYPDHLERTYPNGIIEQLRIADSIALFAVIISSPKPVKVDIIPYFTDGRNGEDFQVDISGGTALVAQRNHLARTDRDNYPVWLAIHGEGFLSNIKDAKTDGQASPVILSANKSKSHMISFAVADNGEEAKEIAEHCQENAAAYFNKRRERMEKLLSETAVETGNKRFDKALAWAKLSLDALIMNQVAKGIFAGLPWFNNYWGRDTFISLPGATLVQGRFTEAKQIIRSFAAFQQIDSLSTDYGRIPNIVTTTDKAYNTADGTPRFAMMALDYIERSGDSAFVQEIYPVIKRSIQGTIRYHNDSLGFLVHGDAETWMDAVGPDGPWSPRGNRANDIQALWSKQLHVGQQLAAIVEDTNFSSFCSERGKKLRNNFNRFFLNSDGTIDHLNADGTSDRQIRPNQIFTSNLLSMEQRARVLHSVVSYLTYEYGVASLWQEDMNFHPFHQNEPYYPKDAAYHNGTVWTWLQGPVISELCAFGKHELAYKVTENTIHQILDRGAVGTQSELLDAIARPGQVEPSLSGTFSQAWNLAEFVRNFYDDYLGIRVERYNHHLMLRPMLPKSLGKVNASINLNGRALPIEVDQSSDPQTVTINAENLKIGGTARVELRAHNGEVVTTDFHLPAKSVVRIELRDTMISLSVNRIKANPIPVITALARYDSILGPLSFATPKIKPRLKALKGPDYPLISHSVIKRTNPDAKALIDASDPVGDDVGSGAYVYPKHPTFVPGCFDITHFTVRCDNENAYFSLRFKALSNPGWHPEYGFQLTYVAIAIDEDGIAGSGTQLVPQNSSYLLNEHNAYEKLILVGGGVQLEDKSGKIIAAYIPTSPDIASPLGSTETGTISFALPLAYLGKPAGGWTFTVLTGGQDDHGGSGLGEFRTVNKGAGEWNGGGKTRSDSPNVYDVLITTAK